MKKTIQILSLVVGGLATSAFAQADKMPSQADIRAAKEAQPAIPSTEALKGNTEKAKSISQEKLLAVPTDLKAAAGNDIDFSQIQRQAVAASKTAKSSGSGNMKDIAAFMRDLENAKKSALTPQTKSVPALLVFISLGSMPRPSLEKLIEQSEKTGSLLVMRGLYKGSLQETASYLSAMIGKRKVALQIDPRLFDRFEITRTPTFTLLRTGQWEAVTSRACEGSCIAGDQYVKLTGDMTIEYALDTITRVSGEFTQEAKFYLDRVRPRQ